MSSTSDRDIEQANNIPPNLGPEHHSEDPRSEAFSEAFGDGIDPSAQLRPEPRTMTDLELLIERFAQTVEWLTFMGLAELPIHNITISSTSNKFSNSDFVHWKADKLTQEQQQLLKRVLSDKSIDKDNTEQKAMRGKAAILTNREEPAEPHNLRWVVESILVCENLDSEAIGKMSGEAVKKALLKSGSKLSVCRTNYKGKHNG